MNNIPPYTSHELVLLISYTQVLSFADRDQEDRIDPMVYIFPRSPDFHLL